MFQLQPGRLACSLDGQQVSQGLVATTLHQRHVHLGGSALFLAAPALLQKVFERRQVLVVGGAGQVGSDPDAVLRDHLLCQAQTLLAHGFLGRLLVVLRLLQLGRQASARPERLLQPQDDHVGITAVGNVSVAQSAGPLHRDRWRGEELPPRRRHPVAGGLGRPLARQCCRIVEGGRLDQLVQSDGAGIGVHCQQSQAECRCMPGLAETRREKREKRGELVCFGIHLRSFPVGLVRLCNDNRDFIPAMDKERNSASQKYPRGRCRSDAPVMDCRKVEGTRTRMCFFMIVEMHLHPNCPMVRKLAVELEFFREKAAKQKGSREAAFLLCCATQGF